jgi:hypothetical protein
MSSNQSGDNTKLSPPLQRGGQGGWAGSNQTPRWRTAQGVGRDEPTTSLANGTGSGQGATKHLVGERHREWAGATKHLVGERHRGWAGSNQTPRWRTAQGVGREQPPNSLADGRCMETVCLHRWSWWRALRCVPHAALIPATLGEADGVSAHSLDPCPPPPAPPLQGGERNYCGRNHMKPRDRLFMNPRWSSGRAAGGQPAEWNGKAARGPQKADRALWILKRFSSPISRHRHSPPTGADRVA